MTLLGKSLVVQGAGSLKMVPAQIETQEGYKMQRASAYQQQPERKG
jgi:hypothetical protein